MTVYIGLRNRLRKLPECTDDMEMSGYESDGNGHGNAVYEIILR